MYMSICVVECVYCRLSGVVYTNLGQPYHEGVVTDGIVVDHRYLILGSFYSCTSNHDWNYVGVLTVLSLKVRCTDEAQKAETVVPYACLCIGYTVYSSSVCVCESLSLCVCVCVYYVYEYMCG